MQRQPREEAAVDFGAGFAVQPLDQIVDQWIDHFLAPPGLGQAWLEQRLEQIAELAVTRAVHRQDGVAEFLAGAHVVVAVRPEIVLAGEHVAHRVEPEHAVIGGAGPVEPAAAPLGRKAGRLGDRAFVHRSPAQRLGPVRIGIRDDAAAHFGLRLELEQVAEIVVVDRALAIHGLCSSPPVRGIPARHLPTARAGFRFPVPRRQRQCRRKACGRSRDRDACAAPGRLRRLSSGVSSVGQPSSQLPGAWARTAPVAAAMALPATWTMPG